MITKGNNLKIIERANCAGERVVIDKSRVDELNLSILQSKDLPEEMSAVQGIVLGAAAGLLCVAVMYLILLVSSI